MKSVRKAIIAMAVILVFPPPLLVHRGYAEPKIPVITIHARRYHFTPSEITLKEGQTVKLRFIADDVDHGLAVDGLGINIQIRKNHLNTVVITPSQAGDFAGECIRYCGVGHDGMKFLIHVGN